MLPGVVLDYDFCVQDVKFSTQPDGKCRRDPAGVVRSPLAIAMAAIAGCDPRRRAARRRRSHRLRRRARRSCRPGGYYVNGNTVCKAVAAHRSRVARPSLEWSSSGEGLLAADFQRMATWKANVVRVPLNQDSGWPRLPCTIRGTRRLSTRWEWAEAAGMDVILDLHWWTRARWAVSADERLSAEDADGNSVTFWSEVASRYAGDGRVLFELYNEPHDVSWDVWLSGGYTGDGYQAARMQKLYDTVGRPAPTTSSSSAASTGRTTSRRRGPPCGRAQHRVRDAPLRQRRVGAALAVLGHYWGALTTTDPVIVTEFGDTKTCADDYAREVLDYADAHAAGWTAWAWIPRGCDFPSLLTDWAASPSALGATIKADLLVTTTRRRRLHPAGPWPSKEQATSTSRSMPAPRAGASMTTSSASHEPRRADTGRCADSWGGGVGLRCELWRSEPRRPPAHRDLHGLRSVRSNDVRLRRPGRQPRGQDVARTRSAVAGPLFGGGVQLVPRSAAQHSSRPTAGCRRRRARGGMGVARIRARPGQYGDVRSVAGRWVRGSAALRQRGGSGDVFTAAGGATVIELDDVAD